MLKLTLALAAGLFSAAPFAIAETYVLGPDSERHPGVPEGKVTKYEWTSKIYPGTVRNYWVYVPAQYKPDKPACTMVFNDGGSYVNETGAYRTTVVLDNLIAKGDLPVIIAIFVDPGVVVPTGPETQGRYDRSYEYDAVGDRYPRFLMEEILPAVGKLYNLSSDPNDRAIAGTSSGGNCSVNAAWTRPDAFHRVLSFIGGFTNLRGDHVYPSLVRRMETKPLRIFLQDGLQDVNVYSNYELSLALEHAGYDHKLVVGTEAHNSKHAAAILPEALRWIWRDYPTPIAKPLNGPRHFLTNNVLDPAKGWEVVSQGHKFTEGPAVDGEGNVFFSDVPNNRIHRIGLDGKVSVFREDTGGASGLMFGADGRLYACQKGRRRIVAYSKDGKETVISQGIDSDDLAVNAKGEIYVTDPTHQKVWFVDAKGNKRVAFEGIGFPTGVRFSPDQSFLLVADTSSRWVWSFLVQPDGSLTDGVPFHRLEIPDEVESGTVRSGSGGMTIDSAGFLYVATRLGIQICDPPGKVVGILDKPQAAELSSAVFGGSDLQTLYVTSGDKVFRREIRRKGVVPWVPVKPPKPSL